MHPAVVANVAVLNNMQTHPKPVYLGIQDIVVGLFYFSLHRNIFFVPVSEEAHISDSHTHKM